MQFLNDLTKIADYGTNALKNVVCLPYIIGNLLTANILGEAAAVAAQKLKILNDRIARLISQQFQNVIGRFTNKLTEISQTVNNIARLVCGIESLFVGLINDIQQIARSFTDLVNQDEECNKIGAQISACIRFKIYNQLSRQLEKGIVDNDLYNNLNNSTALSIDSLDEKTINFIDEINVQGITQSYLQVTSDRLNRTRLQLDRINQINTQQVVRDV